MSEMHPMLSPREAAQTLDDAGRAARRSGLAFGYRIASLHLIMWGAIWFVGYGVSDVWPQQAGYVWIALTALGTLGAFAIARFAGPRGAEAATRDMRFLALVPILAVFIGATYSVMAPVAGAQQAAFVPLLAGAIYAGVGVWAGARYIVLGVALTLLTLGGFFYLREHFFLWMAFVGGGSLILSGLWFRRV